jgi:hypothetical protein
VCLQCSISKLKNLNIEVNFASSSIEHVVICNRCKAFNIDAFNEHVSTFLKLKMMLQVLMLNLRLARIIMRNKNLLEMPTLLVDTHLLRMDLVSKRRPIT